MKINGNKSYCVYVDQQNVFDTSNMIVQSNDRSFVSAEIGE